MSDERWARDRARFRERRVAGRGQPELQEIAMNLLYGRWRRTALGRWAQLVARLEDGLSGKELSGKAPPAA